MKTLVRLMALVCALAPLHAKDKAPKPVEATVAYDRLGRENVRVAVKDAGGDFQAKKKRVSGGYDVDNTFIKKFDVEVSAVGANTAPCIVEFYLVAERVGYLPLAAMSQQFEAPSGAGSFTAICTENAYRQRMNGEDIKGWFVRVVRDGVIVGVAASAPKWETMATTPSVLAQFSRQQRK